MPLVISPLEMKRFIIEVLALEDVAPEAIGDDDPLFDSGLGLDSIDALELGIALKKTFNVQTSGENPATRDHFRTVKSLTAFVAEHGS